MENAKLDEADIEIVRLLQSNGRLTHEQIGREVHLSRPAVHERVKRLEQTGVLRGYGAQVDWDAIGFPLTAFVWVSVTASVTPIGKSILRLTSPSTVIEECHRVAGEWCLILKTRSASSLALEGLLDRIVSLPGVQNTMTTVVLSTVGESMLVPREAAEAEAPDQHRATPSSATSTPPHQESNSAR